MLIFTTYGWTIKIIFAQTLLSSVNAFVDVSRPYVLEIDHTSEKVSTMLSNHVSSLLAQQNHVAVVIHYVVTWP